MTSANSMSILKGWGGYAAAVIVRFKALAPYALIELVLPGGSVMALLLWLYRRRKSGVGFGQLPERLLSFLRLVGPLRSNAAVCAAHRPSILEPSPISSAKFSADPHSTAATGLMAHSTMVAKGLGRHLTNQQRKRWMPLLPETADELNLPGTLQVSLAVESHSIRKHGSEDRIGLVSIAPPCLVAQRYTAF